LETFSEANYFQSLPPEIKKERLESLTDKERLALLFDWDYWARPTQMPPINKAWYIWLILTGRGWGKSRTAAEWIRAQVEAGYNGRIHLIGPTAADVRDTMIEGESGILAICPPWNMPRYEPTKRRVTWPNGARITTFSAEIPDRLRGPQCGLIWADEVASWQYPEETWDMAMFGFRKGTPRGVVTTTPRPIKLIKDLTTTKGVVITKGNSSYEKFKEVELVRIAVAIDPAVSAKVTSNETGIIAGGVDANGEAYILADGSGIMTPIQWARQAVRIFASLKADRIVAEVNNGGDLVESNLRTVAPLIPYQKVHASRGKRARAEPISSLYEQGLVHHVGVFPALEDQQTTWDATDGSTSPDRVDALVWLLTYLMLGIKMKKATSRRS